MCLTHFVINELGLTIEPLHPQLAMHGMQHNTLYPLKWVLHNHGILGHQLGFGFLDLIALQTLDPIRSVAPDTDYTMGLLATYRARSRGRTAELTLRSDEH